MPSDKTIGGACADNDELDKLPRVLALSGGVGGAKLALGLYRVLNPWDLGIAVNTGDDFEHFSLHISPDVDTIMYTLSETSNIEQGWGRDNETWSFLEQIGRLGGDTWFRLGDGDLAVHMRRTELLKAGNGLGEATANLFRQMGISAHIYPMSDDAVRTIITTADGRDLPFQHYFVREQCEPEVRNFTYAGASESDPYSSLLAALENPSLRAVILCPSNPFVSINPILSVPGIRQALLNCPAPVIAVSPIVGGAAVKGPLAKMLAELGKPVNNHSIVEHYGDFLSGFILDRVDAAEAQELGCPTLITSTVMQSIEDRETLALEALGFADQITKQRLNRVRAGSA
jgi:LPPG:FO 2-phospho-L-lactate transferase